MEEEAVLGAFTVLDAALQDAAAMPPSDDKTERIRGLVAAIQVLFERASRIRAAEAFRLAREQQLSYGQLAARTGMSKARAHQLLTAPVPKAAGEQRRGPRHARPAGDDAATAAAPPDEGSRSHTT